MSGWTTDDRRTTALWQAADRALATYRLYAEEMALRAAQKRSVETLYDRTTHSSASSSAE